MQQTDPVQVSTLTERAFVSARADGHSGNPDGILVLMRESCPHCHHSMAATHYATRAANGVPVTWLNLDDPRAAAQLTALGIPYQLESDGYITPLTLAGEPFQGVPTVMRTEQGRAASVLEIGAFNAQDLSAMGAREEAYRAAHDLRSTVIGDASDTLVTPGKARDGQIQLG